MEATGRGHFVGVTMSVLQNQDGWWGEGDDMFFVDGESCRRSMEPDRKIIFWARGILAGVRFRTDYLARRS